MKTLYMVQSITCYGPHDEETYDKKAAKLRDAGFIRCRSEQDAAGKRWEVWLGYDWMLAPRGLENKAATLRFLMGIGPGSISVAEEIEHWGASPD